VISLLGILCENFYPSPVEQIGLRIPLPMLEESKLIVMNCSVFDYSRSVEDQSEDIDLTSFDIEGLAKEVVELVRIEKNYFQQVSGVLIKLMQDQRLSD
jgi:hypothetical protein